MRPLKPMVGVVKSLGYYRRGPVGLVHTQKIEAQSEKPTWTKALEFTQFACPCGTDHVCFRGTADVAFQAGNVR